MQCPTCKTENRGEPEFCTKCGAGLQTSEQPAAQSSDSSDAVATIIPYRNAYALIAYYTGLFSFICVIGLVLAPVALVLGILGLRHRKRHPEAHGVVHAWVGIILGGIFTLVHYGLLVMLIIGWLSDR